MRVHVRAALEGSFFGPIFEIFSVRFLGRSWGDLGAVLGRSWAPPGASWGGLGVLLGRSWALLEPSWGPPGPLLVPSRAILEPP